MLIYVEFGLSFYCLVTLSYKRLIFLFFTVCLQGIYYLELFSIISKLCLYASAAFPDTLWIRYWCGSQQRPCGTLLVTFVFLHLHICSNALLLNQFLIHAKTLIFMQWLISGL